MIFLNGSFNGMQDNTNLPYDIRKELKRIRSNYEPSYTETCNYDISGDWIFEAWQQYSQKMGVSGIVNSRWPTGMCRVGDAIDYSMSYAY